MWGGKPGIILSYINIALDTCRIKECFFGNKATVLHFSELNVIELPADRGRVGWTRRRTVLRRFERSGRSAMADRLSGWKRLVADKRADNKATT